MLRFLRVSLTLFTLVFVAQAQEEGEIRLPQQGYSPAFVNVNNGRILANRISEPASRKNLIVRGISPFYPLTFCNPSRN